MPFEERNKAAFVLESHQKAYLLNTLGAVQKQGGCFLDPGMGDIFVQGFPGMLLKNTAQLLGRIAALLSHRLAGQKLPAVLLNVGLGDQKPGIGRFWVGVSKTQLQLTANGV